MNHLLDCYSFYCYVPGENAGPPWSYGVVYDPFSRTISRSLYSLFEHFHPSGCKIKNVQLVANVDIDDYAGSTQKKESQEL